MVVFWEALQWDEVCALYKFQFAKAFVWLPSMPFSFCLGNDNSQITLVAAKFHKKNPFPLLLLLWSFSLHGAAAGSWSPCRYFFAYLYEQWRQGSDELLSSCGRSYFSQNKSNKVIQNVALHTNIWWIRVARIRSAWRWRERERSCAHQKLQRERERETHTHTHTHTHKDTERHRDGRCLDINLKWSMSVWRIRDTYKRRDEGFFAVLRESAERRRRGWGGGERDELRSLTPCLMSRCDCNRGVCSIFYFF
jgi:hypothetical protein